MDSSNDQEEALNNAFNGNGNAERIDENERSRNLDLDLEESRVQVEHEQPNAHHLEQHDLDHNDNNADEENEFYSPAYDNGVANDVTNVEDSNNTESEITEEEEE
eukprot:Pgem_evm1s18510